MNEIPSEPVNAVPPVPPVEPPPPPGVLVWLSPFTVSGGVVSVEVDVEVADVEVEVEVDVDVEVEVDVEVDVDVEVEELVGLGDSPDAQWLSLMKAVSFWPSYETVTTSPTPTGPGVSTEKLPSPLWTMS
jgi:hypothetical protein